MKKLLRKPLALPLLLLAAVALVLLLVQGRDPVEHDGARLPERVVEVIELRQLPFRARVTGYGNVEPAITLEKMTEVSGRIGYLHPKLKRGSSLPAGTVVVRIDPVDYEVLLRQTEADLAANRQSLLQLEEEEKSTERSLELAKRNLVFARKELERIAKVYERKLVSRSSYESEQQKVLQQEQQVEDLQGRLNTYQSRKDSVKAQIRRAEEQVLGQQTDLGRTEIRLPFDARIGEVYVEEDEFVRVGGALFEALDVTGVEIDAQLPTQHMGRLVRHAAAQRGRPVNMDVMGIDAALQKLKLSARVRLVGHPGAEWSARVLRVSESVDPQRRTLGIVVGVDNPYEGVVPGVRPPLTKGMYTTVMLYTPARPALVIPRRAVHEGRAFVVGADGQLEIRPLSIAFRQGDLIVVDGGLAEGEQLVVTDLYPVIPGMPLRPIVAEAVAERLRRRAAGESVDEVVEETLR